MAHSTAAPPWRRLPTAATLASLPLLLALLASRPAAAQTGEATRHNPLAGSRVYGDAGCAACHAIRGHGGEQGPDLASVEGDRTVFELGAVLWNHVSILAELGPGTGASPSRLGPDEAGDLVAFLAVLGYFGPEGDPEEGRRLFRRKNCVECHQLGGTGGVVGPNLDFLSYLASPIEVAVAMWNHGPQMTRELEARAIPRPELSDAEFVDLVAFLRSASPDLTGASLRILPGDPADGSRLYRTKRCVRCHGLPGRGGGIGPDLAERQGERSPMLLAAAMWNHQPEMGEEARRRGLELARLSPAEMADLVAYLASVRRRSGGARRAEGRRVALRRGCLDCHTLGDRGGGTAAPLESYRLLGSPAAMVSALWNHVPAAETLEAPPSGWPRLPPGEGADLSAFLSSLDGRR